MDAFVSLDVTPARVIALYPEETISGRLHVGLDQWVEVFGGPKGGRLVPVASEDLSQFETSDKSPVNGLLRQVPHLAGLKKRPSADSLRDKDKGSMAEGSAKSSAASVVEYEGEHVGPVLLLRQFMIRTSQSALRLPWRPCPTIYPTDGRRLPARWPIFPAPCPRHHPCQVWRRSPRMTS